ncbi:MAG: 3-isopropylmalate dehydratase small subunit [Ramlibacter sp.]|nr:3-isopropylmalate dehydratase small subunit [Ramlibacter sp.]
MNKGFVIETGRACLLDVPNIDTDIIIPQTELATISRTGLGTGLFARWRYREGRTENPEFALNQGPNRGSRFLIAANNFGCGSSREHAVWALEDFGIRAVISPRFGEIFRTNCVRNGVLAAVITEDHYAVLAGLARQNNGGLDLSIDLDQCLISAGPVGFEFQIDAGDRHRLLHGIDEIEETLAHVDAIEAFSRNERARRPWLHWTPWSTTRDTNLRQEP